ncbi:hypothetical protein L3C95_21525 [Chitinophaga filiformis]|uniref:hypothetical protein n=1 Tax=Chitinophaga filiformis TaxID=104663 RepID=UPI001F2F38AE|nr:hypothetical protein [Chitinophaga filiformis]MCF6405499.1 hypothetical protein [Chitinophaga filiformis]
MKRLLDYFSRLGSKYNLTFSSQEVLRNCIIGLDGVQRKLLVLNGINKGTLTDYVIDLNKVTNCSVKKQYGRIRVNGLRTRKLEQYLENMSLHFKFMMETQPADIPFFRQTENKVGELSDLEDKAEKWKVILSKMLPLSLKKSA